jgi:hypothetical protein
MGRITDLVRCSIVAESVQQIRELFLHLTSMSVVGLDHDVSMAENEDVYSLVEEFNMDDRILTESSDDRIFRITSLENRLDVAYDDSKTWGFRNLPLNVEVGWILIGDKVSFQKVRDWKRLGCTTHICEIQILTRAFHNLSRDGHRQFRFLRDMLGR